VVEMFRKNKRVIQSRSENRLCNELQDRFKAVKEPSEAVELLHEAIDFFKNVDKHTLEHFILYLRQTAEDLQYKYYKARCNYIIIPPQDSLAFWVSFVLGSLPETSRFSFFEGEVHELLKVLSQESDKAEILRFENTVYRHLPEKEVEIVLSLFKEKYPVFFTAVTKDPVLIPIMNFSVSNGSVLSIPRLHCFGLFKPKNETEHPLVAVMHSFAHILHYQLTEDLDVLPPGFSNLHSMLFDELEMSSTDWAETFAETVVSSLLYESAYMPLVAYMELSQQDQKEISNYLIWLETIYASSLQDNIQKLILKSEGKLRA
jgi:hypothetical protein